MKMSKKGFSLIELLVVLAILTILMGLVVPKVGRMMDEAKEHKCRNNLKQLHVAVISHVNDKKGYLPYAMSYEVHHPINDRYYERRGWIAWKPPSGTLSDRWRDKDKDGAETTKENGMIEDGGMGDAAKDGIENGSLYPYMNASMEHYACPLIKKEKGDETYRTYAMNGFFHSPRASAWDPRQMNAIGTSETIKDEDKKVYKPEAAKLLLFAEVEPTFDSYKHAGADAAAKAGNDKRATDTISGDCCIYPPKDSSKTDTIYSIHRSPVADKKASLAVFLDGHIEKIFPENSDGKNSAWFYARGLNPEDPL